MRLTPDPANTGMHGQTICGLCSRETTPDQWHPYADGRHRTLLCGLCHERRLRGEGPATLLPLDER